MQLAGSTHKLQLTRSSDADIDVVVSYVDASNVSPPVVQGDSMGTTPTAFASAATGDILAAPAGSELRKVMEISIANRDPVTSCDVTVKLDVSATDFTIIGPVTLRPGESLHYIDKMGWLPVYTPLNPAIRTAALSADHSSSSTTPDEVTGISLTTGLGKFDFRYKLITTASTALTGPPKLSVNHTGTVTEFNYWVYTVQAATAAADGTVDGDVSLATGGLVIGNAARAKSTAGLTAFAQHDLTTAVMYVVEGVCVVSVDGDLELWHGSETAAVASVVKAGSGLRLIRLGD